MNPLLRWLQKPHLRTIHFNCQFGWWITCELLNASCALAKPTCWQNGCLSNIKSLSSSLWATLAKTNLGMRCDIHNISWKLLGRLGVAVGVWKLCKSCTHTMAANRNMYKEIWFIELPDNFMRFGNGRKVSFHHIVVSKASFRPIFQNAMFVKNK